jgi:tRNA wybutosine-synthesizing protein 4
VLSRDAAGCALTPPEPGASQQNTSIDAIVSKFSAMDAGYFRDAFLTHVVPEAARRRRSPVINRGYWARFAAFDLIVRRFLASWPDCANKQVVSLGGGSETTYFRLASTNSAPHLYIELDLADVARRKAKLVMATPALSGLLVDARLTASGELHAKGYKVVVADLAQDPAVLERTLVETCGLDCSLPTLFVSECVLVYMDPEASGRVIEWAGTRFPRAVMVTYEQILPEDAFGRTMMANLKRRGCELKGISAHPTLDAQSARFASRSWAHVQALDMKQVYDLLDVVERMRIEKLEIFDEFEEFWLMMTHYALTVAWSAWNPGDGAESGRFAGLL